MSAAALSPAVAASEHGRIPVLDIGPYLASDGGAATPLARAIARTCEDTGFLVVANHGLKPGLIEDTFAVEPSFYPLPRARRRCFSAFLDPASSSATFSNRRPFAEIGPRGFEHIACRFRPAHGMRMLLTRAGAKLTRRGTLLSISSARRWRLDGGSSRWPPATPPRASASKPARLSEPRPIDFMMSAFASGWNVIVRKRTLEDNNHNLRKLVTYPGTGPFRSVRRVENAVWVMERNPNYWNKGCRISTGSSSITCCLSTGGFNRLRGRDARFAVAQDARGSDPSLATTRNPMDVGLGPQAARRFRRLRHGPGGDVLARQGVTGTRISRVTPAGSVIFSGEQDNLTAACSDEKRAKGERCHDRPI